MKLFSKLSLCLGLILAIAPWIHAQDIPWEDVDKTGSDLADLATRDASNVTNTPAGNIAATDAQAAINELDSEKATTAQGALADSATQPGDNVSTLTNDSGYLTTALAAQQFAARAMQGYGINDGATADRGEILTPGAIGATQALPQTYILEGNWPAVTPSAAESLVKVTSDFTDTVGAADTFSFLLAVATSLQCGRPQMGSPI